MNWYKKAKAEREHRFITEDELRDLAKSVDYSLLQCVECGRWVDFMKKAISDWKFENEMSEDELKVVSATKEEIANGRGKGLSTCRHCVSKSLKEAAINSTMSVSPSVPMSPMSEDVSISPRQIHTRDDVIQNREDIAPSMLRKRRKKKKRKMI